jgi:hypothetical protein
MLEELQPRDQDNVNVAPKLNQVSTEKNEKQSAGASKPENDIYIDHLKGEKSFDGMNFFE